MVINLKEDQSLFDIALIYFGGTNAAFQVARANNVSVTDMLLTGREIELPELDRIDSNVNFYKNNNIEPATGDNNVFAERIATIADPLDFFTLISGEPLYFINSDVNTPITPLNSQLTNFTTIQDGQPIYFINNNQ